MKSGKIKPSKCVSKVSKNIGLQSTCVHSGVSREYYRNKIHSLTEKVVSQARISHGKSESDRQDYLSACESLVCETTEKGNHPLNAPCECTGDLAVLAVQQKHS